MVCSCYIFKNLVFGGFGRFVSLVEPARKKDDIVPVFVLFSEAGLFGFF